MVDAVQSEVMPLIPASESNTGAVPYHGSLPCKEGEMPGFFVPANIEQLNITLTEQCLLSILAGLYNHSQKSGEDFHPGDRYLANRIQVGERHIHRMIDKFFKLTWVSGSRTSMSVAKWIIDGLPCPEVGHRRQEVRRGSPVFGRRSPRIRTSSAPVSELTGGSKSAPSKAKASEQENSNATAVYDGIVCESARISGEDQGGRPGVLQATQGRGVCEAAPQPGMDLHASTGADEVGQSYGPQDAGALPGYGGFDSRAVHQDGGPQRDATRMMTHSNSSGESAVASDSFLQNGAESPASGDAGARRVPPAPIELQQTGGDAQCLAERKNANAHHLGNDRGQRIREENTRRIGYVESVISSDSLRGISPTGRNSSRSMGQTAPKLQASVENSHQASAAGASSESDGRLTDSGSGAELWEQCFAEYAEAYREINQTEPHFTWAVSDAEQVRSLCERRPSMTLAEFSTVIRFSLEQGTYKRMDWFCRDYPALLKKTNGRAEKFDPTKDYMAIAREQGWA